MSKTYKDIKRVVMASRRVPMVVFVITISQVRPGGQKYYNYFLSRPGKFSRGQVIPKRNYKEKVVSII